MTNPLGSNTIVRLRAPWATSDRDGVSLYRDWDNATEVTYTGVLVMPFKMSPKANIEEMENREYIRTALRFFVRGDQDFEATDRVLWKDFQLEVFGVPAKWYRFNGEVKYTGVIAIIQEG